MTTEYDKPLSKYWRSCQQMLILVVLVAARFLSGLSACVGWRLMVWLFPGLSISPPPSPDLFYGRHNCRFLKDIGSCFYICGIQGRGFNELRLFSPRNLDSSVVELRVNANQYLFPTNIITILISVVSAPVTISPHSHKSGAWQYRDTNRAPTAPL